MWSHKGFSEVASAVGTPLYPDALTEKSARVSFERICVEVSASKPLMDSFVLDAYGDRHIIQVEYQWKPSICTKCAVFGDSCKESDEVIVTTNSTKETNQLVQDQQNKWKAVTVGKKQKKIPIGLTDDADHTVLCATNKFQSLNEKRTEQGNAFSEQQKETTDQHQIGQSTQEWKDDSSGKGQPDHGDDANKARVKKNKYTAVFDVPAQDQEGEMEDEATDKDKPLKSKHKLKKQYNEESSQKPHRK